MAEILSLLAWLAPCAKMVSGEFVLTASFARQSGDVAEYLATVIVGATLG